MKKLIGPIISISIIAVISAVISIVSDLGYWPSFIIVAAALLINGFVATVEDDLPGGFNNPDGTETPEYISKLKWLSRAFIILVIGSLIFLFVIWMYA